MGKLVHKLSIRYKRLVSLHFYDDFMRMVEAYPYLGERHAGLEGKRGCATLLAGKHGQSLKVEWV
jgi:hypothetical protein